MATQLTTGMFGIDPAAYQTQQQNTEFNQDIQRMQLTPLQRSELAILQGARGFGRAVGGMMGLQDPQMAKAAMAQQLASKYDLTNPDQIDKLAQELNQNGAPDLAAIAVDKANKIRESRAEVTQRTAIKPVAVGEQVNQALYSDALRRAGGDPIKAAQIYDAEELAKKQRVAAAGVPQPGQVPLSALDTAMGIVDKYTGKPKTRLEQISVLGQVGEAVKTNPTLLPQFKRDAVKFAGDNQVGQKEVKDILGSAGFAGDVIDGVNAFLTGAPTNAKIDDVLKGFKVLEGAYAKQYEAGRKKADTVLTEGKITEQTRNAVLPPAYNIKPKVVAPAVGTIRGKYRFKGGNPALESNWEAI